MKKNNKEEVIQWEEKKSFNCYPSLSMFLVVLIAIVYWHLGAMLG